jgi:hypothetical protein
MKAMKTLLAGAVVSAVLLPVTAALAKPAPPPPPPKVIVAKIFNNADFDFSAFTPDETIGTILAKNLYEAPGMGTASSPDLCTSAGKCTYDFTFVMQGLSAGDTTTLQLSAQAKVGKKAVAENISFDVFSGTPGSTPTLLSSPTFLGASDDTSPTAPVITLDLGNGSYYVQVTPAQIAVSGEEASGSLQATIVPEPMAWTLMLVGFGAVGAAVRSRRRMATATA